MRGDETQGTDVMADIIRRKLSSVFGLHPKPGTGRDSVCLDQLDAERSRWMLWAGGAQTRIAVYFGMGIKPALCLGRALAAVALALGVLAPKHNLSRAVAIGFFAALVGVGEFPGPRSKKSASRALDREQAASLRLRLRCDRSGGTLYRREFICGPSVSPSKTREASNAIKCFIYWRALREPRRRPAR